MIRSRTETRIMDLRDELRRKTHPLHAKVETVFEPVDIRTSGGLRRFLLAHHAAIAPIERRLSEVGGAWSGCWPFRLKDLLVADLQTLDVRDRPTVWRGDLAVAHPLGLCYVLGGSRLGARLLLKRLSEGPGYRPARPSYLASAPDDAIWTWTKRLLASDRARSVNRQDVLSAAESAFSCFADALALVETPGERHDAVAL